MNKKLMTKIRSAHQRAVNHAELSTEFAKERNILLWEAVYVEEIPQVEVAREVGLTRQRLNNLLLKVTPEDQENAR